MHNTMPISDLRNYTSVTNAVSYGNRVYLTKNGRVEIAMIDMKELDDIEKELALYKLKYETVLDEADKYAENHPERVTHEDVFGNLRNRINGQ